MKNKTFFRLLSLSVLSVPFLMGCNAGPSTFTVRFVNYDGSLLYEQLNVEKNTSVEYTGNRPARFDDNKNYYTFSGWDQDIKPVDKDITYTATFDAHTLTNVPENPVDYNEKLPDKTGDGEILHAFCWTYNDVKKQLPFIVNAGYKSVQLSPVQTPKSNGSSWWAFYQPLSFSIAESSPLGTKDELEDLCDFAEVLDVSIIVDVVFNHMANVNEGVVEEDGTPKVSPKVADYEPEIYAHRNDASDPTFHHSKSGETQSYPGLPDLNTANKLVQKRALDFLKECIDVGVDGFRFDAAKHIETPDDGEYASDFWPNTLGVAKEYYKEKTGDDLFAYGEILGGPSGKGRSIDNYLKYMDVNDDAYGSSVNTGVSNKKASSIMSSKYKVNDSSRLVGWLQSHDEFTTDKNPWSNDFLARGWAVLASRKNYHGLYLAKTDSNTNPSVGIIGDYFFRDEKLGTVNRFHNRFVGADELQSSDGTIYVNERFSETDKGAVVVNTGPERKIVVEFTKLGTDVYYDQMTGKAVTVRNGHATIELEKNGVAVLTKSKNGPLPTMSIDNRGGLFVDEMSVNVSFENAKDMKYCINDGELKDVPSDGKITFTKEQAVNNEVHLTIECEGKYTDHGVSETFHFISATMIEGYFNVLNVSEDHLNNYEIYMWSWKEGESGKWSKDYFIQDGIILVDTESLNADGFLFGRFEKGYVVEDVTKWDDNVLKQTTNIAGEVLTRGYYDGSTF